MRTKCLNNAVFGYSDVFLYPVDSGSLGLEGRSGEGLLKKRILGASVVRRLTLKIKRLQQLDLE